jgi:hypothetical protein
LYIETSPVEGKRDESSEHGCDSKELLGLLLTALCEDDLLLVPPLFLPANNDNRSIDHEHG